MIEWEGVVEGMEFFVSHDAEELILVLREEKKDHEAMLVMGIFLEIRGEDFFFETVDGDGVFRLRLHRLRQGKQGSEQCDKGRKQVPE